MQELEPEVSILPPGWMRLDETMDRLGRSQRTIQSLVKDGHLKCKRIPRKGRGPEPIYWSADVERLAESTIPPRPKRPSEAILRIAPPRESEGSAENSRIRRRSDEPEAKLGKALDTVSIVGQMVAGHKAEMEMLVAQMGRNLETVVSLILAEQKAARDDVRQRWEIERQDRLERQRARLAVPPIRKRARPSH